MLYFGRFLLRCSIRSARNESERISICSARFTSNFVLYKDFHTSSYWLKRRKTGEEKNLMAQGKNIIRFSPKAKKENTLVDIWKNMTVNEVAISLERTIGEVFEAMTFVANSNKYEKRSSIIDDPKIIKDIVKVFGYKFRIVPKPQEVSQVLEEKDAVRQPPAPIENLRPRPPVITVMGHVDHGKTTLLDSLRNSNVVDQEFGGITQHIGAFRVQLSTGETVTFLDTPGHAAFHAMRARGANVTDMVVLVVAADDGVMEQTVESIRMAREANVPIIVAINKIDKHTADIKRTEKMLSMQGIVVENLGGDVQSIPISALKGTNVNQLVEAIILQAHMMELTADPTGLVEGAVVEAQNDPRKGKIATVIVQRGTLKKGCVVVAGEGWAKVRAMFSSDGSAVTEAPPSTPVQLLGWREMPSAGDDMIEVASERRAAEVMRWRHDRKVEMKQETDLVAIQSKAAEHQAVYQAQLAHKRMIGRRYKMRQTGPMKKMIEETDEARLNIIIKGDVDGSVEAILDVLVTYDDHKQCKLDIVHYGVGNISENDLELAEDFDAVIYGFNVQCPPQILSRIEQNEIKFKPHKIIYKMIDDLKQEINSKIPTVKEEKVLGEATVLQPFIINEGRKKVFVAGSRCIQGTLKKNALFKLIRDNETIYDGKLDSMRHLKNEVDTIKTTVECGLKFEDSGVEIEKDDKIICYEMVDVQYTTTWSPPGF